jgi:hypothetical protein
VPTAIGFMRKHELREDYVERSINEMSQYEFLQEISDALVKMQAEAEAKSENATRDRAFYDAFRA